MITLFNNIAEKIKYQIKGRNQSDSEKICANKWDRNVQTKKESMVNGVKSWVVSGYLVRDKMGRAKEQGVPTFVEYNEANKGYIDNKNDSLKIKTVFDYDAYGRFYKAVMANGYWVTKEYETRVENDYNKKSENRIVSKGILKDSENRESIEYTDMGGAVVRTEVKKDKNSTEMIAVNFEYDLHGYGKVTESTGAIGEKQFNSLGALLWMKTPDAGKFEYVYNDKLQVVTVKDHGKNDDGNARVINYSYDDLNRMIDIKYSGFGSNDIKYEYYDNEGDGNRYARSCIKKISKGSYFEAGYDYEQLSIDVKKTIEGTAYTTKFTYDVQGRIDNVVYPDGEKITYSYDEGGYLTGINGTQSYISDIRYNEYGQRTYLRYGNGLETKYEYTKETGLLDKMKQLKGANELLSYDYDFDLTGNLTKLTDTPNGANISIQNYSYDLLGRINSADGNYKNGTKTYNETYSFDDDNRILEKTFGNGSKYKFNYQNNDHAISSIEITGSPIGEKSVEFNYDDFGNMTKKMLTKDSGTSITEFKYDEANKLINIILPEGNKKLEFKYDNGGQRITKEFKDGCGTLSKNVYINGFYELVNDTINKHISDGQYIFATKLDNKDENTIFYTSNNIGSTTLLTNKDGSDIGQFLYTPFGEMWVEEASEVDISHITRFFTNQQYDKESGLYYYNARYYDPHLGSFLTPDPAFDGLNHYAYANSNPIKYNDPTGLLTEDGTIESGDTLSQIAKDNNTTVDDIMDVNPQITDPDKIYTGDHLNLPGKNPENNKGTDETQNTDDKNKVTPTEDKSTENITNKDKTTKKNQDNKVDIDSLSDEYKDLFNKYGKLTVQTKVDLLQLFPLFVFSKKVSLYSGFTVGKGNFGIKITNGKKDVFAEQKIGPFKYSGSIANLNLKISLSLGNYEKSFGRNSEGFFTGDKTKNGDFFHESVVTYSIDPTNCYIAGAIILGAYFMYTGNFQGLQGLGYGF